MTRTQANVYLAAILSTLNAVHPHGAPSGVMYAAMMTQGITLDEYQTVLGLLLAGKLVERHHDLVTLTSKGECMALAIDLHAKGHGLVSQ